MLVLFETPAGYALFKVSDAGAAKAVESIAGEFETADKAHAFVRLAAFHRFPGTTEAVVAATALVEGKLSKDLKSFLKKQIVKKELTDELAVSDAKLGGLIKDKLDIPVRAGGGAQPAAAPLRACSDPPLPPSLPPLPPPPAPLRAARRSASPTTACTRWCAASAAR
jgi:hypothetical protein